MKVFSACLLSIWLLCAIGASDLRAGEESETITITVGSKKFTESVVLGEIIRQKALAAGAQAEHRRELGGTRVLFNALLRGDIDVYPEYSGTIRQEILAGRALADEAAVQAALADQGIQMSKALGFNNTYALGMREETAEQLGITTISDLRQYPDLSFGFSNEFMDRADGWPGLRAHYSLPQSDVKGLDHDLAYRGLEAGSIQLIDMYSTDAEISYYKLRSLIDDQAYFPAYQALLLYRSDLTSRAPAVTKALLDLQGAISEKAMVAMNAKAKLDRTPESQVAADFLAAQFGLEVDAAAESKLDAFLRHSGEHIMMVLISLTAAILLAIPLGIIAAKQRRAGQLILGVVGVIQTVPSLALLVFMIPLLGIGTAPAICALFLYSLLPIVRNTYAGLHDISPAIRESAEALGLPPLKQLRQIELPMASRSILAGIKISAVINVGTATLGALIGAGGYGQPILTGIRLDDVGLILSGAIPAAGLALVAQGLFEIAERLLVPRGLRLSAQ